MKVALLIISSGFWLLAPGSSAVAVGDYEWPLGKEAAITGTFGEYREGHFHTGIDFSTNGEIGMPVYAVADAEVYRVVDSLTGFGKAVYLKHRDGRRSVYAHLDRFGGGIEKFVARKRRGMKFRDKLDTVVSTGELARMKKGDLIGYSGESGGGLPHLHFELRENEETPIHPADFLPRPTDHTPPHIRGVFYAPVIETEAEWRRYTFSPEYGCWIWPDYIGQGRAPKLYGRIWIHVLVTDTSEFAPRHNLSPRRIVY